MTERDYQCLMKELTGESPDYVRALRVSLRHNEPADAAATISGFLDNYYDVEDVGHRMLAQELGSLVSAICFRCGAALGEAVDHELTRLRWAAEGFVLSPNLLGLQVRQSGGGWRVGIDFDPAERSLGLYSVHGRSTPGSHWHWTELWLYEGSGDSATFEPLIAALLSDHVESLDEIAKGYEARWRDGNWIGTLTPLASATLDGVRKKLDQDAHNGLVPNYWGAADWFQGDFPDQWWDANVDFSLADILDEAVFNDVYLDDLDVEEYLRVHWVVDLDHVSESLAPLGFDVVEERPGYRHLRRLAGGAEPEEGVVYLDWGGDHWHVVVTRSREAPPTFDVELRRPGYVDLDENQPFPPQMSELFTTESLLDFVEELEEQIAHD